MNKYLSMVCDRLYEIGVDHYQEDRREIRLMLQVMAQASDDVYHADVDDETRKDALDYFDSDVFLHHCMLAGLSDEHSVKKLFLSRPGKGVYHVVR